jgi:ADP-L-glycero-D-manno-heptose 6-epimerase
MIIVTGGAGFIGSNLVHALNDRGRDDVIVVDDLSDGEKFLNIRSAQISDYIDHRSFLDWLAENGASGIDAIFHLGACSDTTEWDGRYMLENNYQYAKEALDIALVYEIPFIYASSAAVYGSDEKFKEVIGREHPLNVYGYSKALLDRYVAQRLLDARSQIVGLRYFNVYGPREQHKGRMASIAWHLRQQYLKQGAVRLFEGSHGYGNGEQRRDFVHVDDVVGLKLWFLENANVSGIFNCGTGCAEPFNEVANAVLKHYGSGVIKYIPFPEDLSAAYQSYTCADLDNLRKIGCTTKFRAVAQGVADYMSWLDA